MVNHLSGQGDNVWSVYTYVQLPRQLEAISTHDYRDGTLASLHGSLLADR